MYPERYRPRALLNYKLNELFPYSPLQGGKFLLLSSMLNNNMDSNICRTSLKRGAHQLPGRQQRMYANANKASAFTTGNTSYYVFNIETHLLLLLIPPIYFFQNRNPLRWILIYFVTHCPRFLKYTCNYPHH